MPDLRFCDQNCLIWVFLSKNHKKLQSYLKSAPSNLCNCKILQKNKKCLNFGPKLPDLGIFDQKCLIWVFLSMNCKRAIVSFEVRTPKFVYLQNFTKKQKYLYLEQKMSDLGIFAVEFENSIVIFEIKTFEFA